MNIYEFKNEIKNVDNYEQQLSHIRLIVNNQVLKLKKEKALEIYDFNVENQFELELDEDEDFKMRWDYIGFSVSNLYNKLNLDLNELMVHKQPQYSNDDGLSYYDIGFSDVWYTIEQLDDIEFLYAVTELTKYISEDSKLNTYISKPLSDSIDLYLPQFNDLMKPQDKSTVFIAIAFSDKTKNARKAIKEVVETLGYLAVIIDEKDHNNSIVPEIFYEIEKSEFVISDFTSQRAGVYYEAGYAKALKKEVIHTCLSSELKKLHFDVAQISTVLWDDEQDLKEKLLKRIKATIK